MWNKKDDKISISSASFVDLKAELLKTKEKFEKSSKHSFSINSKKEYTGKKDDEHDCISSNKKETVSIDDAVIITTGPKIHRTALKHNSSSIKRSSPSSLFTHHDQPYSKKSKLRPHDDHNYTTKKNHDDDPLNQMKQTEEKKLASSYVSLQRKANEYQRQLERDPQELFDEEQQQQRYPNNKGKNHHDRSQLDASKQEVGNFLVDFLSKERKEKDENESNLEEQFKNTDDPWIEYTDDFGRTRLIRQSEASKKYHGKFQKSSSSVEKMKNIHEINDETSYPPTLISTDMSREFERQEWEKQAQEDMLDDSSHFNQKGEIRTLGTGFYKFSHNEQERQEQLKKLNQLRYKTMNEREQAALMKESKKNAREQRVQMLLEKKISREHKMNINNKEARNKSNQQNVNSDTKVAVKEFFDSIS